MTCRVQEYHWCITCNTHLVILLSWMLFLCAQTVKQALWSSDSDSSHISCYSKDNTTCSFLINWRGHQTKHTQRAKPDSASDEQIYYIRLQRGHGSKHITWYDEQSYRDTSCVTPACAVCNTNTNKKTTRNLQLMVNMQRLMCACVNTVRMCVIILIEAYFNVLMQDKIFNFLFM